VIHGRAQQVVAGAAFNMLIIGVAPFVTKALYGISGGTPALDVATENQDFARVLMAIVTCASLFSPFAIWWILERTRPGLLLRFAGEEPGALESAGVSPRIVRTAAVVASGALAALGGATLSVLLSSSFARGMTGGRGFMALAAVIFAGWRPIPAAVVCLVFAGADAAQIRLQGSEHTLMGLEVPVQLIQALPYLLTFIAVALRSGVTNVPRYLGRDV
jgi:simple sugar transport system permease protein